MIGTFPGKLSFADGDEVDVDLEIAAGQLKLVTGISEIGSWPLAVCALEALSDELFHLSVDGDQVRFAPDHPDAFSRFVMQLGSNRTVVAQTNGQANGSPGGAIEALPVAEPDADPSPAWSQDAEENPGEQATDEDITMTLEALFASAFGEEVEGDEAREAVASVAAPGPFDGEPSGDHQDLPVSEETDEDLLGEAIAAFSRSEHPDPGGSADEPAGDTFGSLEGPGHEEGSQEAAGIEPEEAAAGLTAEWQSLGFEEAEVEGSEANAFDAGADLVGIMDGGLDARGDVDAVTDMEPATDPLDAADAGFLDTVAEGLHAHRPPPDQPVTSASDWDSGFAELDEWSPEATAAALQAEISASEPEGATVELGAEDPGATIDEEAGDVDGAAELPISEWPDEALRDLGIGDSDETSPTLGASAAFEPQVAEGLYQDSDPWDSRNHTADTYEDVGYEAPEEPVAGSGEAPGGDRGWFRSSATERLASVADAIKERGEYDAEDDDMTVAEEVLATQQKLRDSGSTQRDWNKIAIRGGVAAAILAVVGGLAFLAPRAIDLLADSIESAEPETEVPVETTAPVAADEEPVVAGAAPTEDPATTTTVSEPEESVREAPQISIFDRSAADFVATWDRVGTSISPRFEIPVDLGEDLFAFGFTDFVGMEGRVDGAGRVAGFTVVVDPRGESQDDRLGIQALGIAIGVVDPSSSGADRSRLLRDLGLDVSAPNLAGIDGEVTRGGVRYRLVYGSTGLLRFSLSPAGATDESPLDGTEAADAGDGG